MYAIEWNVCSDGGCNSRGRSRCSSRGNGRGNGRNRNRATSRVQMLLYPDFRYHITTRRGFLPSTNFGGPKAYALILAVYATHFAKRDKLLRKFGGTRTMKNRI